MGCGAILTEQEITLITDDADLLLKYHNALLETWVNAPKVGERVYHCGMPNCQGLAILAVDEVEAICGRCANHWCVRCLVKWHSNQSCEVYERWRKENDSGDAKMTELIKQVGIAQCPNCANGVEKSHGCNHMTCRCGTHFCYLCAVKLTGDYYAHFNGGACLLFTGKEYE